MVAMLTVSEQLMVVSQSQQVGYLQNTCRVLISKAYEIDPKVEDRHYTDDLDEAQAKGVRETALQIIKERHANQSHPSSH